MKNEKIAIGVIGAGRAGMIHATHFRSCIPGATLVAVADPAFETAARAARELEIDRFETDPSRILEDPAIDAVLIAAPTGVHCELAEAAAAAGKHILCEKPMAMTEAECDRMIAAASAHHVKLQLAFMRRFDPAFQAAKKAIGEGQIGDVVMVRSNTRGPSIPKPWMYDISKSNGPLAEVNSHDIDTVRWFSGSEFRTVHAIAGNYRCPDAKASFPDFYDNVAMLGEMEDGSQSVIDGAQGVLYGYDARVEILGTCGCIYIGRKDENGMTVVSSDMKQRTAFVNSWRFLFKDAYLAEDTAFIRCILENGEPQIDGRDGKMAVRVVNAGNRSIREKKIIALC